MDRLCERERIRSHPPNLQVSVYVAAWKRCKIVEGPAISRVFDKDCCSESSGGSVDRAFLGFG